VKAALNVYGQIAANGGRGAPVMAKRPG
jgi:hypothetical protein